MRWPGARRRGAVLDRIVYTLCNPTAAGLVAFGKEWPGLRTRPRDIAGSETAIRRPDLFFREDGPTPESVVLRIVPPEIDGMTGAQIADEVERRVDARERELRAEAARAGRTFLGARGVRAQDPFASPRTREPRRTLSPRVAAAEVQLPMPVNRFPDFVAAVVTTLRVACPLFGKVRIAQMLARAGLRLSASTVARILARKPSRRSPSSVSVRYRRHRISSRRE